ncbi:MAG: UvrD-helicase domain-containing protein [Solirubrobacteraceae bacterium]
MRTLSDPGQQLAFEYAPSRASTDEQEQAIRRRRGSLLLAAGAGSGKTSVLVERFVRAVREDGIAPGRILAITFTERAAGELRERVRARLLDFGERDFARDAQDANVSTFHAFCARLLRIHPLQAGVEPGFRILEEGFAERLRVLAFREALARFLQGDPPEAVDLIAAYGPDHMRGMVFGAYAHLRSLGQAQPRLPVVAPAAAEERDLLHGEGAETSEAERGEREHSQREQRALRACELIGSLMECFDLAYAQRKQASAVLDFDDLELKARVLLDQHADIRQAWAERFDLLMVDEFQDSNPRQLQMLAALDRDNLFTVGDELQSIYGFRHADVGLFRERRALLAQRGASLALTRNFRSRPAILTAVERIFAARMGSRFAALSAAREEDSSEETIVELLLTDKRGWDPRSGYDDLRGMSDATPWRQAEARLLAERVAGLVAGGQAQPGEIVVLLRALGDAPVYESALRRHGLPTLAGVGGFWGHQQVGDLLAWLRTLANPLDEIALYSTLASPMVGASSDALATISRFARGQGRGVWRVLDEGASELEPLLPPADRGRIASFRELLAKERESATLHSLPELLRRAIASTGYEAHVLSLTWGERRLANVHKLIRLARHFEAQEGLDLRGFLDHVAHLERAAGAREADAPVGDGETEAVRLMSIHAAKGLEFPVVCVADLGRDPNLRYPDLLLDDEGARVGLRLLELSDPEPAPTLDYEVLRDHRRVVQEEEEDRVLYVACTRARDRLLLSGSVAFERWPPPRPGLAPIVWLAPALVPDAPSLAASEQPPAGAFTTSLGDGLRVRCVFNSASQRRSPSDLPGPSLAEQDARGGDSPKRERIPEELEEASSEPRSIPTERHISTNMSTGQPGDRSPEVGDGLARPLLDPDATMSYTSLAELERCGYRYYLERVLRLPENRAAARGAEDGGIEARTRGTIVHILLESIDFARPKAPTEGDVEAVARRIGARVAPATREEIAKLLSPALTAKPAQRLARAGRARREHPFAFALASTEPVVTGVLDLIVEEADGAALIVDYKSDRLIAGPESTCLEDLERLVERDYSIQRLLYALAAIEDGIEHVEVAHWFLERPHAWVSACFVASERSHLREQLRSRIADARAEGFAVTKSPHRTLCLTCPGRGGLCSWGEERTMVEQSPHENPHDR